MLIGGIPPLATMTSSRASVATTSCHTLKCRKALVPLKATICDNNDQAQASYINANSLVISKIHLFTFTFSEHRLRSFWFVFLAAVSSMVYFL
jgi:hypothetical protein